MGHVHQSHWEIILRILLIKSINRRFKNASEVVRAGLKIIGRRRIKSFTLRNAIEEGEKSGIVKF